MENDNMTGFEIEETPPADGEATAIARRDQEAQLTRHGFGTTELQRQQETMSTAMAAAKRAQVEARYIVARMNPRNPVVVRERMLGDCRRPGFADVSEYRIKRGKVKNDSGQWVDNFIEGPSIRFAEAARTASGNIDCEIVTIYDDPNLRIVQVTTTDLESNITESATVNVVKSVERKQVYEDHEVLSVRTNSEGKRIYIVRATAAEVNEMQNSLTQRVKRNQILALIPGDLKAEAIAECRKTKGDANRKQIVQRRQAAKAAFERVGVLDPAITAYLGHPVIEASAEELDDLQMLYNAIKEGETTWAAATARQEPKPEPAPVATAEGAAPAPEVIPSEAPRRGNAGLRDALSKAKDG
jgi:hypothetical protein